MNYRHAYHAGNFADVVKHVVLMMVIEHLKQKDTPFRVIDTHAGVGAYDLTADAAERTGEWHGGIGRLIGADAEPLPAAMAQRLAPYLDIVRALNPPGSLRRYPGSPRIARALLRPQDRLVVNELHPEDAALLRQQFPRDSQTKVLELDGWTALKALLPPNERRGVILIDPPFEAPRELDRLVEGLAAAVKRFATGVFVLWYPIKDPRPVAAFHRRLVAAGHGSLLRIELMLRPAHDPDRLNGCGLIVVNAPYQLDASLTPVLAFLSGRMAETSGSAQGWAQGWPAGGAQATRGAVEWLTKP